MAPTVVFAVKMCGGGGEGGVQFGSGSNATTNTGSGGGGAGLGGTSDFGGNGASGLVIVRYAK